MIPLAVPLLVASCIERRDATRNEPLLCAASFVLNAGDRIGLQGPSGSGKSVLLRTVARLEPLHSGTLALQGPAATLHTDEDATGWRRLIAYVAQRPALFDGSVLSNLQLPYGLKSRRTQTFDAARATQWLAAIGRAPEFLDNDSSQLSGGEQQIVALIRTLLLDPSVLLLDEPTAALDPEATVAIEALVERWFVERTQQGAPVAFLWVTHSPDQALRVATVHWRMERGCLDTDFDPVVKRRNQ